MTASPPPAPSSGPSLRALKTVLELKARDATIDAYITAVPVASANAVLTALRALLLLSPTPPPDLQHLRRFAKPPDLPAHLRAALPPQPTGTLYLLLAPTTTLPLATLTPALAALLSGPADPIIHTVLVPLLPPTSAPQAAAWSASHWPTVYKNTNPFGPHPRLVSRAEAELGDAGVWMEMARRAAEAASEAGGGEAVGAVVVRRDEGGVGHALAVAGDARWASGGAGVGQGNVMAHAVLRAVGMVARKLRRAADESEESESPEEGQEGRERREGGVFLDGPLLEPLEREVFDKDNAAPEGYLCHNLEIYVTHEPCVMCAMALLHSRFGRVVVGRRMERTGALCAEEAGLGHGLGWRRELNWSLLAWEIEGEDEEEGSGLGSGVGSGVHA